MDAADDHGRQATGTYRRQTCEAWAGYWADEARRLLIATGAPSLKLDDAQLDAVEVTGTLAARAQAAATLAALLYARAAALDARGQS